MEKHWRKWSLWTVIWGGPTSKCPWALESEVTSPKYPNSSTILALSMTKIKCTQFSRKLVGTRSRNKKRRLLGAHMLSTTKRWLIRVCSTGLDAAQPVIWLTMVETCSSWRKKWKTLPIHIVTEVFSSEALSRTKRPVNSLVLATTIQLTITQW